MENMIQVFENKEFGKVRTVEENGKVMFVASDVAKALGYSRPADAITAHCKGAVKHRLPTNGGMQDLKVITESDMYYLVANSKLPAAKRFETWIKDMVSIMDNVVTVANIRGYISANGAVMLNAEDVARGWGFTQFKNGVEYVRWDRVNNYLSEFGFSPQVGKDNFLPENMVYRLGFKANNNAAQKFQSLLADEVLPAIRKHGAYVTPQTVEQLLADPDTMIKILMDLKQERASRLKAEQTIIENRPKVIFAEAVESSDTSILVGELAKLIKQNGVELGEKRLFTWLRDNGYLMSRKCSDWNMPTQKSMELGLFEINERNVFSPDGSVRITKTPRVTGKGQTYFINKFLSGKAA
jgi:prophage antirepressor-like protein